MLEIHLPSSSPSLLENCVAQLRTCGRYGALVQGGIRFVVGVDGSSEDLQQTLCRAEKARRALCLTLRPRNRGQPFHAVGDVRPVCHLLGEDQPFLEEAPGTVVIAAGEGDLRQVVERYAGPSPVPYPAGHHQSFFECPLCPAHVATATRPHPPK